MFVAETRQIGDLVGMRKEVSLWVAQVGTVEPHITLVEQPVEHNPAASFLWSGIPVETGAVNERPLAVGKRRLRPPVARHAHPLPRRVVKAQCKGLTPKVIVRECCSPRTRKIHR